MLNQDGAIALFEEIERIDQKYESIKRPPKFSEFLSDKNLRTNFLEMAASIFKVAQSNEMQEFGKKIKDFCDIKRDIDPVYATVKIIENLSLLKTLMAQDDSINQIEARKLINEIEELVQP